MIHLYVVTIFALPSFVYFWLFSDWLSFYIVLEYVYTLVYNNLANCQPMLALYNVANCLW